nr:putative reverse transcriptase domain-containing protein [Tanacetum cinerariifolium]
MLRLSLCAPKCHKCNKIGHLALDCRVTVNTNNANNQRGTELGQKPTCYECGVKGHYKRECPKLRNNNNQGNQGGRNNAPARVYAIGRAGTDPDAHVVTGTFLLNNRYASILFDTGADRSFVSTTFSTQINITPSTLDHCYDVELADGRTIGWNTILRSCTLNLLNHPFNIDLMPVELGRFDAIIGMDWLAKYQAIIVCAEKIVRIPWGSETLIIHDDASGGKKQYGGSKPLCAKCNYHHDGPCAPKCHHCNKSGHFARDCRVTVIANDANNQKGTGSGQKSRCYECGVQGHFKRECPKLKNNNNQGNQGGRNNAPARVYTVGRAGADPDANIVTGTECPKLKNNNNQGNQGGRNNAPARVYVVGCVGADPDANVVTGTFLLNNRYASILFDTGADRSFVSTTFSTQVNITPSTLDHCYDVELADGRIIGLNTILRSCTLNLLNHPFNIDLIPVELGSFDAIIGMD